MLKSNDKIGIVVPLGLKAGVSRTVATISQHFGDKIVIFSSCKCDEAALQEIPPETVVNEIYPKRVLIPVSLLDKLVSGIFQILALWKILRKEKNIKILNPHKRPSLLVSCAFKIFFIPRKIKISWFLYNEADIDAYLPLTRALRLPLKPIIRILLALRIIDQILVLNDRLNGLVRQGFKTKQVYTLRLGVSSAMVKLSEQLSRIPLKKSERVITLYFHALVSPKRRLEDLIKSVRILKDEFPNRKLMLYISGATYDKHYFYKLVRIIESLDLASNVKFLGFLSDEDLARMYKSSDIFIFPCVEHDWGLAPIEAMLFETPVIISSEVGLSEVSRGKNVTVIVPPRSPEKLADAIGSLIRDKKLRARMGTNASKFVKTHLTYVQTGKRLEKIWGDLLKKS